jgi:hypothetical protein
MTFRCILSTADRIAAGLCLGDIPAKRARKKAVTCSEECQRKYGRIRRQEAAETKCRLCGRPLQRSSKLDPVLVEHKPLSQAALVKAAPPGVAASVSGRPG